MICCGRWIRTDAKVRKKKKKVPDIRKPLFVSEIPALRTDKYDHLQYELLYEQNRIKYFVESLKYMGNALISMKTFEERISDISFHLQSLATPELVPKVKNAVERRNRNLLIRLCRQAKIPRSYTGIIVSILLAASPQQKWPPTW
jgi:hypothetical protein